MGERLEDLMKSVLEDIKNQEYKQAYLFFGEEGYLKKQYRNKLLQAWNPDGDTMNESRFEGKGIDVKEVISLGETMPFFSDRTDHFAGEYRVFQKSVPGTGRISEQSSGLSVSSVC